MRDLCTYLQIMLVVRSSGNKKTDNQLRIKNPKGMRKSHVKTRAEVQDHVEVVSLEPLEKPFFERSEETDVFTGNSVDIFTFTNRSGFRRYQIINRTRRKIFLEILLRNFEMAGFDLFRNKN